MRTQDGFSVTSGVLLASGFAALMATSTCLLGAGLIVKSLNDSPTTTLSTAPWAWVSDVRVGVDQPKWEEDSAPLPIPQRLAWSQLKIPKVRRSATQLASANVNPKPYSAALIASAQVQTSGSGSQLDEIRWQPAAPVRVEPAPMEPVPVGVTEDELLKMRSLHESLRQGFLEALNTQASTGPAVAPAMNTQEPPSRWAGAAPGEALAYVQATLSQEPEFRGHKKRPARLRHLVSQSLKNRAPTKPMISPAPKAFTQIEPALESAKNNYSRLILAAQQIKDLAPAPSEPAAKLLEAAQVSKPERSQEVSQEASRPGPALLDNANPQADIIAVTQAKGSGNPALSAEQMTGSDYSGGALGAVGRPQAQLLALNTQPGAGYSNGSAIPKVQMPVEPTQPAKPIPPVSPKVPPTRNFHSTESTLRTQETPSAPEASPYIEAFSMHLPVDSVQSETLIREADGGQWQVARAEGHVPTLAHRSSTDRTSQIPLFSTNTAHALAMNAGTTLQSEMGLVFGLVPEGWNVSYSGRSERAIYLNAQMKSLSDAKAEGLRYFAFVNASPGAQLLYFSKSGHASSAIGIPVLASTSTYVDLSDLHIQALRGRVLDAGSAAAAGISGVRVRVVGASPGETVTDSRGQFQIQEIAAASDYPLVLETEANAGYTHRYMVKPRQLSHLQLFRMSDAQIRDWVSQLEGGVSPESGMIVGVAPTDLVASSGEKPLYASTHLLAKEQNLQPETYALSKSGQLQVKSALDAESPRFIAVQIPEGPVAAEVRDPAKQLSWSELVFAQPGIVNVVSQ